jgi:hypothetical protein
MAIDSDILKKVCGEVYSKFPAINGCKPKISSYSTNHYLLIFHESGEKTNKQPVSITVRAVVTDKGKVVKLTTSR